MIAQASSAQRVGLVLSGGGSHGLAHIGVIKALEENNIPIDYITGTSAGAMVGSMYASGISPDIMDSLVSTEKFVVMSNGGIEEEFQYFFRKPESDASWINMRINKEFNLAKAIPTNLTNPVAMDFEYMSLYSSISSNAGYNFDSLFVPFRCVASDVLTKSPVVFDEGHLNQAVRASMTYPGYIKPIRVDDKLLFDGGLYNNFPADVMYDEFFPDIIIGVNFPDSIAPPDEDDAFSQLKTMIINRSEVSVVCENGILIEPVLKRSGFDFSEAHIAVMEGYEAAMAMMDTIKQVVQRRVDQNELMKKRFLFYQKNHELIFDRVIVKGVDENQAKYIKNALIRKGESIDIHTLKKRYFRLVEDEKLKNLYPIASIDPNSGKYILELQVKPEKPFAAKFGGVFSSRPINTGYLGLEYLRLGQFGLKLSANSYFGKFYGSVGGAAQLDFNYKTPFYIKSYGYISRWDYFKSFATFFEDVKPSYIVENENYFGLETGVPLGNKRKLSFSYNIGEVYNDYYQTENFTASDTADQTQFLGQSLELKFSQSNLNRKLYSSRGSKLEFTTRYVFGIENTLPGSTSPLISPAENVEHTWYYFNLFGEKYLPVTQRFTLGGEVEGNLLLIDKFFDNYTSTIIMSPAYQPIQESKTFFLPGHVSHDYVAVGLKGIMSVTPSIEVRASGYLFQPYTRILPNNFNVAYYDIDNAWQYRGYIASGALVFHSPLGPASATINYYTERDEHWSFIFNFGYLISNRRFLK